VTGTGGDRPVGPSSEGRGSKHARWGQDPSRPPRRRRGSGRDRGGPPDQRGGQRGGHRGGQGGGARQPGRRGPDSLKRQNLPALLVLLLALGLLLGGTVLVFLPFLAPITMALVVTMVAYPLFRWVSRVVGEQRRGLASGLTCGVLVLLVFVPLGWLAQSLAREAFGGLVPGVPSGEDMDAPAEESKGVQKKLFDKVQTLVAKLDADFKSTPLEPYWKSFRGSVLEMKEGDEGKIPQWAKVVAGWSTSLFTGLLSNTLNILMKFLLMLFILFFFFKDGPQILRSIERNIPLEKSYLDKVVETFAGVSRSIVRGTFGTALIQGLTATAAYAVVGVSAVFWGILTTFCALVPGVGTALVTVPMIGYLSYQALQQGEDGLGPWWRPIVLVCVAFGIGLLDNLVRPILMRDGLRVHSIWLLLAILGGVNLFGAMGLLYGPMVLVFLGTFLALLVREERAEAAGANVSRTS